MNEQRQMDGKDVLITGGLGFIGSTLAAQLVEQGARLTILDACIEGLGANSFNIEQIRTKVTFVQGDVRDEQLVRELVAGKQYVFHLAGQVDHHRSMEQPVEDVEIRGQGTINVLEAVRLKNPQCKIIFSGTRAVYGTPKTLPVTEETLTQPKGMYALTSLAAEKLIQIYSTTYGIPSCCFRITNGYGPRQQMRKPYGIVNWFIRLILDDKPITLMGEGAYQRDFLYVDDICSALIAGALRGNNEVFNVVSGEAVSFLELAKRIIAQAGKGSYTFIPYPKDVEKLEPGDFVADTTKIRTVLGWTPTIGLDEGIRRTIGFYRTHKNFYW